MAKVLKVIDPCLYEQLMQVHKANEIQRLQDEAGPDRNRQDLIGEVTDKQEGGSYKRYSVDSREEDEKITEEKGSVVQSSDSNTEKDPNPAPTAETPTPTSSHLHPVSIEGWTSIRDPPVLLKKRKRRGKGVTKKKKIRKASSKAKKKKSRR